MITVKKIDSKDLEYDFIRRPFVLLDEEFEDDYEHVSLEEEHFANGVSQSDFGGYGR